MIMLLRIIALGCLILLTPVSLGSESKNRQQLLSELNKLYMTLNNELKDKNTLERYVAIKSLQKDYQDNPYAQSFLPQLLAEEMSYLGLYKEANDTNPQKAQQINMDDIVTDGLVPIPAIDAIIEHSKRHDIVMINEAHHIDQHRVLTLLLLEKLWAEGFRYLALENLSENHEKFYQGNIPQKNVGSYSQSPLMALLIYRAKALGFQLIAYDFLPSDTTQERESNAAEVIKKKIFDKDPTAKVLMHVGYSHIDETSWLASKLKETLEIDPLTVNQTDLREGKAALDIYHLLLNSFKREDPFVLVGKGRELWSLWPEIYDVNVVWPKTNWAFGRPTWASLNRPYIMIDRSFCAGFPCMIESVPKEQNTNVAFDRIVIENEHETKALFHSKGHVLKSTTISQ